ncbi:PREDICTED: mas-related G-protein coupled receptor member H-like [Corvus brachyrhynchos]|uniref:mas-related G-protein coupled receptor member H-like n=1 Tax=Corvus brachyrhynchos TaxID=85066 RepID=UPI0004DDF514|nr:PREDICTED: mas-related G-protein coupled receptor member H-like [Corvus brachyrhynchos]
MAVSSVFPPSASPTEEAGLCEIDVTNVAIHSVTLLICLCGLAGNGAMLWLLTLEDFALFIFSQAVADFLFLLFALPSSLLFLLEDVSCSPIMPQVYVSFLFQLSMVSYYWGLLWLTLISMFVYDLCCFCNIPERLSWMLFFALFWAFFALFTVIPTVTFLCPSHEQEHCQVTLTSIFAIIQFLIAAPMVISLTITFIKAKCGSQQKELERANIVIFLVVLFTLFLSLWNFLQQLGYIAVSSLVVFPFTCIHSTIKPFIYFLVGMYKRPCSIGSLRKALKATSEGNTASSNDDSRDMVTLLIPSPALLKDPGTVAEGFLESHNQ